MTRGEHIITHLRDDAEFAALSFADRRQRVYELLVADETGMAPQRLLDDKDPDVWEAAAEVVREIGRA
jgi:hypothetical protein